MNTVAAAIPYWFTAIVISVLAFFFVRFYYLVDEIRKDVKDILIEDAARKQIIETMREDIHEFKLRQQDFEKKLNFLQREIERIKR